MKKFVFLVTIVFLILASSALARQGHMRLLAVKETDDGAYEGGIADLYLEIKPGSGRVFLETFPLTRTDTQMSTRFAKAIACDSIERDCSDLDFFYTITADSAIIAGPSAGASIAVLTVAMLEDLELNEDYTITGTINSGGLIGPVGGLKAKVEAAKSVGMKKVLIPAGEMVARYENVTTDLRNLSKMLRIQVEEVSTLEEAVKEFTGKSINQNYRTIDISEEYVSTMKSLAKDLCDRSAGLKSEAKKMNVSKEASDSIEMANNLTTKGRLAFEHQTFYSSASYCFGANVELSAFLIKSRNLTRHGYLKEIEESETDLREFTSQVEAFEKRTITDLEAYIVVKERLAEAEETLNQTREMLNDSRAASRSIAYSGERIQSARSWANFLGKSGKTFNLNEEVLKSSCQNKISEADERKQYVELYFPNTLDNIKKEIDRATAELSKGNYELCLSMASKAKADVDIILSVFGVNNDQYPSIIERKLEIVRNNIARESAKGRFPILGYSYYEYANSLKNTDIFSALLYSEYALEFGNLDIYFKESGGKKPNIGKIDGKLLGIFLLGTLAGAAAVLLVRRRMNRKEVRKYKPKRKK